MIKKGNTMDKQELIALVACFDLLLDNYEHYRHIDGNSDSTVHAKDALREFLRMYPNIADYDDRGNYIGSVSNENGWTP